MINEDVYYMFEKLSRNDKVNVLKMIMAYNCFLAKKEFKAYSIDKDNIPAENGVRRIIGKETSDGNTIYLYLKENKEKYKEKLVIYSYSEMMGENVSEIKLYDYLNGLEFINASLFLQFLPLRSEKDFLIELWEYDFNEKYKEFAINQNKSQFLIGTGLSIDYGAKTWPRTINEIKNEINSLIPAINPDQINSDLFNTLYGVPQILKDLDKDKYYNCIYNCIYESSIFSSIPGSNLSAVVSVIKKQYCRGESGMKVVTFNYDEYIEKELELLHIDNGSTYLNLKTLPAPKSVEIAHIHGFMPYYAKTGSKIASRFSSSIVLTDAEYNEAYSGKYCPNVLCDFLNNSTIIVGNSLTDYEERKVFKNVRKNDGPFHFILKTKSKNNNLSLKTNLYNDAYIFRYLLGLGVIVIFFDDFIKMGDFIRKLS